MLFDKLLKINVEICDLNKNVNVPLINVVKYPKHLNNFDLFIDI